MRRYLLIAVTTGLALFGSAALARADHYCFYSYCDPCYPVRVMPAYLPVQTMQYAPTYYSPAYYGDDFYYPSYWYGYSNLGYSPGYFWGGPQFQLGIGPFQYSSSPWGSGFSIGDFGVFWR